MHTLISDLPINNCIVSFHVYVSDFLTHDVFCVYHFKSVTKRQPIQWKHLTCFKEGHYHFSWREGNNLLFMQKALSSLVISERTIQPMKSTLSACWIIYERLSWKKRPGKQTKGVFFYQNASAHTSLVSMAVVSLTLICYYDHFTTLKRKSTWMGNRIAVLMVSYILSMFFGGIIMETL